MLSRQSVSTATRKEIFLTRPRAMQEVDLEPSSNSWEKQHWGSMSQISACIPFDQGGAMAMFLSGIPVVIIMRVGRWSSDAFLEYIRDQVESFTAEVSKKMITCQEFVNLNMKYQKDNHHSNNEAIDRDLLQNEDGPDSVSFNVFFSQLALGKKQKKQR